MHPTWLMEGVVLSPLEGFFGFTLSKGSSPMPWQLAPSRMILSYSKFKTDEGLLCVSGKNRVFSMSLPLPFQ